MSTIKIDHDVPLPGRINSKYPFAEMKVGDSFVLQKTRVPAVSNWNKLHPKTKFITRKISSNSIRVWRSI
jgi:hypothetical protein